ncbi:MAG: PKD domain-containing protein [Hyphomicrobiales bacterium]
MAISWNGGEIGRSEVQLLTVPSDPVNGTWTIADINPIAGAGWDPTDPTSYGEGLSSGDIDNDGDADLFQGGNWYRNEGDGTWTVFTTGIELTSHFEGNDMADIDGDGDLDGVVAQFASNEEVAWLAAPADPTQTWTKNTIAPDIDGGLSLFVGDIDFDGDDDIITAEWQGSHRLLAYENDLCDSGTWIEHVLDGGTSTYDHHVGSQVADMDNDGDLDVVSIGWENTTPRIWENTSGPPPETQPVADAGLDRTVSLPTNSIVLNGSGSDPDGGSIISYLWTQQSGPNTATLMGETTEDLTVDDLIEGSYIFRLTVTDDEAETGYDDVTITVTDESVTIRLNSGGPSYTYNSVDWSEDQYFDGGIEGLRAIDIANTENDQLYQTERWTNTGSLTYELPVSNGDYNINLHFAEIFFGVPGTTGESGGVGSRVFNISVENGQQTIDNYDIVERAGGSATAIVENFEGITVDDGNMTITLTSVVNNAKISGIEVLEISGVTQPPLVDVGEDKNITLPTSSVTFNGTANDPDGGSIVSYLWTQQSGPDMATLSGETTIDLAAGSLVTGDYIFRLTVTDDDNETSFDEVLVTVNDPNALPLHINTGGSEFSFNGTDWVADQYFDGGVVITNSIAVANTENDELYQTYRFANAGSLIYEIPVANGDYDLNLHFAEMFFGVPGAGENGGVGSRIFNVDVEGQEQLNNYDIVQMAGGSATAIIEAFSGITVADGNLTITLTSITDNAKISGIEIFAQGVPLVDAGEDQNITLPTDSVTLNGSATDPNGGSITDYLWIQVSGPSAATLSGEDTATLMAEDLVEGTYVFRLTATDDEVQQGFDEVNVAVASPSGIPLRINAGGPTFTYSGDDWLADQFFDSGAGINLPIAVENTENDELYQTYRFANQSTMTYEIPVSNGFYDLNLHFAEMFFGVPGTGGETGGIGSRIFNVDIEGQEQLSNYDIFATSGAGATAVVEGFTGVQVEDGLLTIVFTSVVNNAKVSGIEILSGTLPPDVDAGSDFTVNLPSLGTTINGNANDPDGGTIVTYQWTQEDGPNSATLQGENTQDLMLSDLVEGTYRFRLSATDDEGQQNFDEVDINVIVESPTAVATATPLSGEAPLEVSFDGSSSSDDVGIEIYSWNFEDSNGSSEENPSYTFTEPGMYEVTLTVTDGLGLTDVATVDIEVSDPANEFPVAVATADPTEGNAPLPVIFDASNSTDDGDIVGYFWDFKDGTTSEEIRPVTTFNVSGTYTVELMVTDNEGLTNTATITISVGQSGTPMAIATATPVTGDGPLGVEFDASQSSDDVGIVQYSWDFGDGNSSSDQNPIYTYIDFGVYEAVLTITDADGLSDTDSVTITVNNPNSNSAPVALATATPLSGEAPLEVSFDGSGSSDNLGIESYLWDFGDGSISNDENPTHTYDFAGTFEVTLTVEDEEGLSNTSEVISIEVTDNTTSGVSPTAVIARNPAKDIAMVQLVQAPEDVVVTNVGLHDSSGRLIASYLPQQLFVSGSYEIPIGTLRDGLYYITLELNEGDPIGLNLLVKN